MNATQWTTLTEFVKYLGRTGKCKVEETPKGWFITYIDRDSETLFKEKQKNKRIRADLAEEEKQEREILKQIERAEVSIGPSSRNSESEVNLPKEIDLESGVKVGFALAKSTGKEKGNEGSRLVFDVADEEEERGKKRKGQDVGFKEKVSGSALEELMKEEEKKKEKINRKDYWLCEGIIVKVMSKGLVEKGYYKQKGLVRKVIDKYVGEIEMIESKHVLRVDQEELETVIPQIGGLVSIVNGAYRGENARLLGVNTEKFCAKVQIEKGVYDGRVLPAVEYEDICKLA